MSWQEIIYDILPLVVSFVSAIVLFFRTGKKKYVSQIVEAMYQSLGKDSDSDVVVSTDTDVFTFTPSAYGLTADQFMTAFRSFLEEIKKNGNDE